MHADQNAIAGFTKACSAANYYFWICDLEPTIRETPENRERQPAEDYASYDFSDVKFAYPLAPDNRVLKGISLSVCITPLYTTSGANWPKDQARTIRRVCWCFR